MTPYRQPARRTVDAAASAATEELVIGLAGIVVGAIPCAGPIASGAPMGAEPTIGLAIMLMGATVTIGSLLRIRPPRSR